MILSPYGAREWLIITMVCSLSAAASIVFLQWFWLAIVIGVIWLALVLFFRDPPRRIPRDLGPGDMLAPADGKVSAIEQVSDHAATNAPAVVIRVFLSVLNVHINRAPCAGEIVAIEYIRGSFRSALKNDSAQHNESNLIVLRIESGGGIEETIGVRQIAGKVARRIICALRVGDRIERGRKFGMIKFGSMTELILPRPDDVTIHIKPGDRVRAGRTKLATLAPLKLPMT